MFMLFCVNKVQKVLSMRHQDRLVFHYKSHALLTTSGTVCGFSDWITKHKNHLNWILISCVNKVNIQVCIPCWPRTSLELLKSLSLFRSDMWDILHLGHFYFLVTKPIEPCALCPIYAFALLHLTFFGTLRLHSQLSFRFTRWIMIPHLGLSEQYKTSH